MRLLATLVSSCLAPCTRAFHIHHYSGQHVCRKVLSNAPDSYKREKLDKIKLQKCENIKTKKVATQFIHFTLSPPPFFSSSSSSLDKSAASSFLLPDHIYSFLTIKYIQKVHKVHVLYALDVL